MSINQSIINGRLTRDPELRYTQSGIAVTSFTVAVNRNYKDENGDRPADFINCVAWRQLGEIVANHVFKGSSVTVQGSIQSRSYEDKEGNMRYVTEINAENVDIHTWNDDEQKEDKPVPKTNKNKPQGGKQKPNQNRNNRK